MDIGIIGLPGSGKTSLWRALTGAKAAPANYAPGASIEMLPAQILDSRLVRLATMESSRKTTFAQVNVSDVTGLVSGEGSARQTSAEILGKVRNFDLLMVAIRSFANDAVPHMLGSVNPERDLAEVEGELILADLAIIERRIEKINSQKSRNKEQRSSDEAEIATIEKCRATLESGRPVREAQLTDDDRYRLREFPFLTDRPPLFVLNVGDDGLTAPLPDFLAGRAAIAVAAGTESELDDLDEAERAEFIQALGIPAPARERVMLAALRAAGRAQFFTIGPQESRAWLIRDGEPAVGAAEKIHKDIARGFIRAEVIGTEDFTTHGPWKKLRSTSLVREEGKDYPVRDGDIINVRFSA